MNPGTSRTQYLSKFIKLVRDRDIDVDSCLARAGVSDASLADHENETTRRAFEQVLLGIIDKSDIDGLGLIVGQEFRPTDFGIAGLLLVTSGTLGNAIRRWNLYQDLAEPLVSFQLHMESDSAFMRAYKKLDAFRENEPRLRYAIEEAFAEWAQVGREFGTDKCWFNSIHFTYPEPPYSDRYRDLFCCPLYFDQPTNQFEFPAGTLDLHLDSGSEDLARLLESKCAAMLRDSRSHDALTSKIHKILIRDSERHTSIEEVASLLHMSERTLRRRLVEIDTTFKKVVTDFRMALATEYLGASDLPVSEISLLVGYSDTANFYRAFRNHFAVTPDQFRKNPKRT